MLSGTIGNFVAVVGIPLDMELGPDGIPVEIYKFGGKSIQHQLHLLWSKSGLMKLYHSTSQMTT